MARKPVTPVVIPATHFFATSAFHYARGATRAEAVANVARMAGKELINQQVKATSGKSLYVWSCHVNVPMDQKYGINEYRPEGVQWGFSESHDVMTDKGFVRLKDSIGG